MTSCERLTDCGAAKTLVHPPRGHPSPALHRLPRPLRCLIGMATGARIRNFVLIRHFGRDEFKRVASHIDIRDGLLDLRHVA